MMVFEQLSGCRNERRIFLDQKNCCQKAERRQCWVNLILKIPHVRLTNISVLTEKVFLQQSSSYSVTDREHVLLRSNKSIFRFKNLFSSVILFLVDCLTYNTQVYKVYRDTVACTATRCEVDGSGIEYRKEARYFAPVQTGPLFHTTSHKMGTGSLSRGYIGRGLALITYSHLAPRLKKE
jgi:hypothetical protein